MLPLTYLKNCSVKISKPNLERVCGKYDTLSCAEPDPRSAGFLAESGDDDIVAVLDKLPLLSWIVLQGNHLAAPP